MTDTPTTPQRTPAPAGDVQVKTADRVARYHSAIRGAASFRGGAKVCMALADAEVEAERQRLHDRIEALQQLGPVLVSTGPRDAQFVQGYNEGRADALAALVSEARGVVGATTGGTNE